MDFGVGLEVFGRPGAGVERGQPLCAVWHRNGHALGEALSLVQSAMPVGEEPVAVSPLIQALID